MRAIHLITAVPIFFLAISLQNVVAQDAEEDPTAADLKLLQGQWELFHGNEGKGAPTIRSVKEIVGNRETLRRYDIATGKVLREHSVDFKLTRSGSVNVFTFYAVGGDPKNGGSFVYKVDNENFYDIPGLLTGNEFRNYQANPVIWHWTRVKEEKGKSPKTSAVFQKLKKKIDLNFNRVPLQDVFATIGDQIDVTIEIDGDGLKAAGLTRNMPQTFAAEGITGLEALEKIVARYQGTGKNSMVLVIDQADKQVLVTTQAACDERQLTSHKPATR